LFRDAFEELQSRGVAVVGVSVDDSGSHERFSQHHQLPFSLLADPDKRIARAYGVMRTFSGVTKRVTYVIDRNRTIRGVFHHELLAGSHLKDIRAVLKDLAPEPAVAK
jgi:peroxiredoxin Q/BCP